VVESRKHVLELQQMDKIVIDDEIDYECNIDSTIDTTVFDVSNDREKPRVDSEE